MESSASEERLELLASDFPSFERNLKEFYAWVLGLLVPVFHNGQVLS